jgi:hypothetical protein
MDVIPCFPKAAQNAQSPLNFANDVPLNIAAILPSTSMMFRGFAIGSGRVDCATAELFFLKSASRGRTEAQKPLPDQKIYAYGI